MNFEAEKRRKIMNIEEILGEFQKRISLQPGEIGYLHSYGDFYFDLMCRYGISETIKIARIQGKETHVNNLLSWVAAGLTDEESKEIWKSATKSESYNKTYYWRSMVFCTEEFSSSDAIRYKKLHPCKPTP